MTYVTQDYLAKQFKNYSEKVKENFVDKDDFTPDNLEYITDKDTSVTNVKEALDAIFEGGVGGDTSSGEDNKINSISVNGTEIAPDENKNVDITVPTISQAEGNQIEQKDDGLFVKEMTTKISAEEGNTIETKNDGIYVASTDLSEYYTKDETYSKTEVDTAIANAQLGGGEVDLSAYATTEYVDKKVDGLTLGDENTIEKIFVNGEELTVTDKSVDITVPDTTGFITKAVEDLENYYLKTETYSAEEIDEKITEAVTNGTVDLSGYTTDEELTSILVDYAKTTDIPDVSNFVEKEDGKGLFSGSYNDLTDTPAIPSIEGLASEEYVDDKIEALSLGEENVQSDWNETDETSDAFIKNKPTIPSIDGLATETFVTNKIAEAQLNGSDVDISGLATKEELATKADTTHTHTLADVTDYEAPDLSTYAKTEDIPDVSNFVEKEEGKGLFSGSYNDLADKPTIPSVEGLVSEETLNTTLADYVKTDELPDGYDDTALTNRVKTIEDDYLTSTDKTELTTAIATAKSEAIETVLGENVDADFDTLKEVANWIQSDTTASAELVTRVTDVEKDIDSLETFVNNKVDKVSGKGLSTNDYTTSEKNKLSGIASGAEIGTVTINGTDTKLYAPTNTDTKNTAGSTDSSSKLFLVGATSQAANPQTYSHDTAYIGADGHLYSNGLQTVNLSGSQALTNKTYNGYTLAAACAKAVTDSSSAGAISTGTGLVTERDVYYGLPTINNSHTYTSSTSIYAPVSGGTSGYILKANGSTSTPTWSSVNSLQLFQYKEVTIGIGTSGTVLSYSNAPSSTGQLRLVTIYNGADTVSFSIWIFANKIYIPNSTTSYTSITATQIGNIIGNSGVAQSLTLALSRGSYVLTLTNNDENSVTSCYVYTFYQG